MADQFNDGVPNASNQILSDLADMDETLGYFKTVISNFVNSWSDTTATGIYPAKWKRTTLTSASSPYSQVAGDIWIEANTSGGAIEIDLLAAATAGAGRFIIIKVTDATNTVTIDPNSTQTIDGSSTSYVLRTQYESIGLFCDGSNWHKIFHFIPSMESDAVVAKTGNYTVGIQDLTGSKTFTNTGASGAVNLTLPAGVAGYSIKCIVNAAQYLKCTANGSETFRYMDSQSAAGGYIRSNVVGNCWTLVYTGSDWIVTNLTGSLSVDE